MQKILVEYTEEEIKAQIVLNDVAVKHPTAGGLQIAESALVLARKLQSALTAASIEQVQGAVAQNASKARNK